MALINSDPSQSKKFSITVLKSRKGPSSVLNIIKRVLQNIQRTEIVVSCNILSRIGLIFSSEFKTSYSSKTSSTEEKVEGFLKTKK